MDGDVDEILPSEFVTEFLEFLLDHCADRLEEVVRAPNPKLHYGVEIDVDELQQTMTRIAPKLLLRPASVLSDVEEALQLAQQAVCKELMEDGLGSSVKRRSHARFHNLPQDPKFTKTNISVLRSSDVDLLISLHVTIVRVGSVMLREVEREYECTKCRHQFSVAGDIKTRGCFTLPTSCPSKSNKRCPGSNFRQIDAETTECLDYQEIKAQEKIGSLKVGSLPRSILIVLTNDLVDSCKPGDDAVVTGILQQRWNRNPVSGSRCDLELLMEATCVRLCNEEKSSFTISDPERDRMQQFWKRFHSRPLEGRNHIIRSICPEVYGMYLVKLIIAMSLIGGVTRDDACGTRVRGESHLLIVGDPGTGKSQMLKYAARLSPRAVMTTGIGTTSAGLTVTAVRDAATGEWSLDAGALVLADGGLCCIDEFDSIRESDRVTIHEAMEQQTLSVAKAGLVCTLETKTTVFGATNPRVGRSSINISSTGRGGSSQEDDAVYLSIASPLLSRFDVVLTLMDGDNQEWDERLSRFILDGRKGEARKQHNGDAMPLWSTEQIQLYFCHVKQSLQPQLSSGASKLLSRYYAAERAAERRIAARTTVRLLESLIRLTQAHARLMFRPTAVVQDSVFAIAAVEASALHPTVLGGRGAIHASFPDDAEQDYRNFADYILVKLGLEGQLDLWEDSNIERDSEEGDDDGERVDATSQDKECAEVIHGPSHDEEDRDSGSASTGEPRERSIVAVLGAEEGDRGNDGSQLNTPRSPKKVPAESQLAAHAEVGDIAQAAQFSSSPAERGIASSDDEAKELSQAFYLTQPLLQAKDKDTLGDLKEDDGSDDPKAAERPDESGALRARPSPVNRNLLRGIDILNRFNRVAPPRRGEQSVADHRERQNVTSAESAEATASVRAVRNSTAVPATAETSEKIGTSFPADENDPWRILTAGGDNDLSDNLWDDD